MDVRLKWLVALTGLSLLVVGLPFLSGLCCFLPLLGVSNTEEAWPFALAMEAGLAVSLGCGWLLAYHGFGSLRGKPSGPWTLPPLLWSLAGAALLFQVLLMLLGGEAGSTFLAPLLLPLAALLIPLSVLGWMLERRPGELTARRAWVIFAASLIVPPLLAIVLEILVPGAILWLVRDLSAPVLPWIRALLEALSDGKVARALASPAFVVALVELAVIAPVVEEAVKPLVALPLLPRLERPRDALLAGAVAGAGFAVVENFIYAVVLLRYWPGVLAVRALGAAIHPLGSGLVTLGWWAVLRREPGSGQSWLRRYGLAVGLHALWNGGIVLVAALSGAQFFGHRPWDVDLMGLTVNAVLLAVLAAEGVGVWVVARTVARQLLPPDERPVPRLAPVAEEGPPTEAVTASRVVRYLLSLAEEEAQPEAEGKPPLRAEPPLAASSENRDLALWAVICLLALLPVALALLRAL